MLIISLYSKRRGVEGGVTTQGFWRRLTCKINKEFSLRYV